MQQAPRTCVSQQTTVDTRRPPMSRFGIKKLFATAGIPAPGAPHDRILDEAHDTADRAHRPGLAPTTGLDPNTDGATDASISA
jgi:hypothetical protein